MQFERSFLGMKVTPLGSMPASPMSFFCWSTTNHISLTTPTWRDSLSVRRESFFLNQSCLNWINSLISHNSSGHAFSSSCFLFSSTTFFLPLGIQVRLFCFYLTRPKLQRALSIMKWFIFFCLLLVSLYIIFDLVGLNPDLFLLKRYFITGYVVFWKSSVSIFQDFLLCKSLLFCVTPACPWRIPQEVTWIPRGAPTQSQLEVRVPWEGVVVGDLVGLHLTSTS